MNRIETAFDRLRREGRRGIIPFVTAGDPDLAATRELIVEFERCGACAVELGVPFSDPVADGPVIQRSSERALRRGVGVKDVLRVVAEARERTGVPIVLFSYFNPLMQFGVERLCAEAGRAGVDGILVTDLVPEEAGAFADAAGGHGLEQIFLAAPTSTNDRLRLIAGRSGGFIYAVSRAGVTGTRTELSAEARRLVERVRTVTQLPVAVGFGISTAEQVVEVWEYADAAVIGSAIVSEIERHDGASDLVKRIGVYVRSLTPAGLSLAAEGL
jgi:tryptophan synthase alpha chain